MCQPAARNDLATVGKRLICGLAVQLAILEITARSWTAIASGLTARAAVVVCGYQNLKFLEQPTTSDFTAPFLGLALGLVAGRSRSDDWFNIAERCI